MRSSDMFGSIATGRLRKKKYSKAAYLRDGALINARRCGIGRDSSCRDDRGDTSAQRHSRTGYSDSPGEHCGLSRCFGREGKWEGEESALEMFSG